MRLPRQPRPSASLPSARARGASTAVVLLVLWAVGLCGALGVRERLARAHAARAQQVWIDPRALRLARPTAGFDPRWESLFEAVAGAFPPLRADDRAGLGALARAIAALPFVAAVGEPRVVAGALSFDLTLRVPVACVPQGERFQPVAADGTLLPGLWPAPPQVAGVPLPVLGPLADGRALFPHARAGDFLAEPRHLAALDVVRSLALALDPALRERMGSVLVDATDADPDFPGVPCVSLSLAGGRVVRFGRAPSSGAPGELAAEHKWAALREGLALLQRGDPALDWDRLDVRWDHPELRLVHAPLVADARPASRPRLGAREPAPDPAAPRAVDRVRDRAAAGPALDSRARGRVR